MTNGQVNKMYEIKDMLGASRKALDPMCYHSGDDNLKGDELEMAKAIHKKLCEALDLM